MGEEPLPKKGSRARLRRRTLRRGRRGRVGNAGRKPVVIQHKVWQVGCPSQPNRILFKRHWCEQRACVIASHAVRVQLPHGVPYLFDASSAPKV